GVIRLARRAGSESISRRTSRRPVDHDRAGSSERAAGGHSGGGHFPNPHRHHRRGGFMVIRSFKSILTRRRRGALITEVVVAMGLLTFAMLPLAFSMVREHKRTRARFHRAVVREMLSGALQSARPGGWRVCLPGE